MDLIKNDESKAFWMWNYGEYEIYHTMLCNFRREERTYYIPPMWKVSAPYPQAQFYTSVDCERDSFIKCYINGVGRVIVDGKYYGKEEVITIPKGKHEIGIQISNSTGLPAVYVESDVCPSSKG